MVLLNDRVIQFGTPLLVFRYRLFSSVRSWPIALKAGALPNGRYQEDEQTFMVRCNRRLSAHCCLNGLSILGR